MENELRLVPCKYCDKKIVWGTNKGRPVPLDKTPAVYRYIGIRKGKLIVQLMPSEEYFVNHHATCSGVKKVREDYDG